MVRYLLLSLTLFLFVLTGKAQLSGNYDVSPGGGGDFNSLLEAAEALNSAGMSGNVTLRMANGLYEEQVLFEIPGQTESQMLTIESASGNEADVVIRYADATEEENYQLGFSEIQALTIRNISIDTEDIDNGRGIQFFGQCSNVTIDNINHHGNRNDEALFAYGFTDIFEPPQPIQGLTVTNSFFTECSPSISVGANLFGEPETGPSADIVVTNNEFFDADGLGAGVCENVSFDNNIAYGDQFSVQPVKLTNCSGTLSVVQNRIWNSFNSMEITTCVGTAENPILVANNFISGGESVVVLNSNTELSFVYNSVYADDDQYVIATYSNQESRVLNNIFYQNSTEGFIISLLAEDGSEMDYNNLYSNGGYAFDIGETSPIQLNYQEYIDETGREENGINVQPIFEVPGEDLHTSNEALNAATPLTYVTTDIDGESRNPDNPTIGADEIDGVEVISDLVIDEVTTSGDLDAGQQLTVEWSGSNAGNTTLEAPWIDRVFLSEDEVLDGNDVQLTEVEVETSLSPGDPFTRQEVISMDLELGGTYYVIVRVDAEADLLEENDNNVAVSAPFEITPPPLPNLEVTDIELPDEVSSGTQLQINFTVTNTGEAPASGNWSELIWFEDAIINFDAPLYKLFNDPLAVSSNTVGLMPGDSYEGTAIAETPYLYEGFAYIRIETDGYDDIVEELDGNDNFNTGMIDSVFINQSPLADLVVEEIQTPAETFAGEDITISYTVRNVGTETTSPVELPYNFYFGYTWAPLFGDWVDYTYFSDTTFSFTPDQYEDVESHAGNIGVDETYIVTETIQIPGCISGPHFITAYADRWNHVAELDEANNSAISDTIHVLTLPSPDLIPETEDDLEGLASNDVYTLTYRIVNQGADTASAVWKDRVFISDSANFQFDLDEMVANVDRDLTIPPDEEVTLTIDLEIPPETYGDKHLFLWVDAVNDICEQPYDTNNIWQAPVEILQSPSADLEVAYFPPDETHTAGDEIELSPVVSNIGDVNPNVPTWYDRIFLISEESAEDTVYQEVYEHQNGLAPGDFYSVPGPFTLPLEIDPGFYSIGVAADGGQQVWENESEENNIVRSESFQIVLDSSAVPDLRPLEPEAQTWQIGDAFSLDITITNSGTSTGVATWVDEVYITSTSGNKLASFVNTNSGNIPAGGSIVSQFDIVVPAGLPDEAILNIKIDTTNAVFEYNLANNLLEIPLEITSGPTPDLSPTNLDVTGEINAGQELQLSVILNNFGEANVESDLWVNRVLLSADNLPDDDDIIISSEMGNPIDAQSSQVFVDSIQVPLTIAGSYFLIYQMDAGDDIGEGFDEDNNYVVSEEVVNVVTPAPVDFETSLIDFNITNGNLDNIQYELTNTGGNNFTGSFYTTYYLSEDDEYSSDDQLLGWNKTVDYDLLQSTISLDPGETITQYASFKYLPVVAGDYFVIQKIDALFHVYETDESNNTVAFGPVYLDNIEEIFPDITYDRQFGRNLPPNQIIGLPYQFSSTTPSYPDRHNYKIDIPDGFGMIAHMWENEEANENYGILNESQPIYEMYIGEGYVPTLLNYDFIFDAPLQAEQHIIVPVDEARTDYIKTQAPYIPPHFSIDSVPVSKYKLRAEFREFSIFEAKPNRVGNSHNATLRITGFDLVDSGGFDVALIQGNDTVYAYETYPQDQSELVAYVDMREAPTGDHELLIRKRTTGDVAIWDEPVEVINDYGPTLFADVSAPGASRSSEDFQVQVTFGNRGYSNFYDMLIFVAFFNEDTSSEELSVRYMGSTYPGYTGSNFISDSLNPAYDVFYDDPENPVVYAARVPIVHARSRETFTFTVNGEIPGVITTQASLSVLQRSPFTFTGRMEDVETSTYGAFLGAGMMAAGGTMEAVGNAKSNCGEILNADAMTERLANETYKVAEKARGASGMKEDVKKNYKTLTGHDAGIKERYDSYKELMSTKDELDLTANEDTPFYSEINDMFDCMDAEEPGQVDIDQIPGEDCKQIATWERGGKTFRVKMDMRREGSTQCPPPPEPSPDPTPTPTPKDQDKTDNENSEDPNEIVGPPGEGFNRLVSTDEEFRYTVYFENVEEAGAPARRVRIDNPLSDHLRLPSFRLVSFGFADTSFQFNNPPYLQETFDLGSEFGGQQLRVLAGTNPSSQKAFFEFTTINPETQGLVTGAGDGFLFPNDSTGRGQGFVTYIVEPKSDLAPGTEIENQAAIIFDENEIIETNTWKNTIRGGQLASRVLELPLFSSPEFTLNWVNETPAFGPAVESFDIFVRDMDEDQEWSRWLGNTKSFKKRFTGMPGHTYGFKSRAKSSGSYEPLAGEADAVTTILDFRGDLSGNDPVLFPNPARDMTTMAYRSPGAGAPMRIRISSTQGKVIDSYAFNTGGGGVQYFSIPVADMSAGVYLVELYNENNRLGTAKLVLTGFPEDR